MPGAAGRHELGLFMVDGVRGGRPRVSMCRSLPHIAPWVLAAAVFTTGAVLAIVPGGPVILVGFVCAAAAVTSTSHGWFAVAANLGLERTRAANPGELVIPVHVSLSNVDARIPFGVSTVFLVFGRLGLELWSGAFDPKPRRAIRWTQVVAAEPTEHAMYGLWPGAGMQLATLEGRDISYLTLVPIREGWLLPLLRSSPDPYVALIGARSTWSPRA